MASLSIAQIKAQVDTEVRQKVLDNSVSTDNVADQFDAIADAIGDRGVVTVGTTAEMEALSSAETKAVMVAGVGLFAFSLTGTPNGTSVFTATGGGYWVLQLSNAGLSYSESIYGS